jgi:hypothetical protein
MPKMPLSHQAPFGRSTGRAGEEGKSGDRHLNSFQSPVQEKYIRSGVLAIGSVRCSLQRRLVAVSTVLREEKWVWSNLCPVFSNEFDVRGAGVRSPERGIL